MSVAAGRRLFSPSVYASYAAGALLIALFLRTAEWRVFADGRPSIGWLLLTAAVATRFASLVAASARWQVLLRPACRVRLGSVVAAMMMGMAVNTGVSMQAAEFVRPYILCKREGLGFTTVFATVAVEWVLDLIGVVALCGPAMLLLPRLSGAAHAGAVRAPGPETGITSAVVLALLLGLVGLGLLGLLPRGLAWLADRMPGSPSPGGLRQRFVQRLDSFAVGLQILLQPMGLLIVAAYSLLVPFLAAVSAWLALMAFGLPVSFLSGFVVLGLITVGGLVPTPGAVGGFHAVCQFGLVALFAFEPARTVLPVIGLHAVLYVPPAAVGLLYFLWTPKVPLRDLARRAAPGEGRGVFPTFTDRQDGASMVSGIGEARSRE